MGSYRIVFSEIFPESALSGCFRLGPGKAWGSFRHVDFGFNS